jgi:hypothetical protein
MASDSSTARAKQSCSSHFILPKFEVLRVEHFESGQNEFTATALLRTVQRPSPLFIQLTPHKLFRAHPQFNTPYDRENVLQLAERFRNSKE